MATPQDRNGGYVIAVFVSFDDNRELPLRLHELILAQEKTKPLRVFPDGPDLGIHPPERINTFSFLTLSCSASVAALMNRLSVPTTPAGPLLQTLILMSIPLGVSFLTIAVERFRMSSG